MTTTRLWNALRLYEYRKLCIMKRTCISPFSDSLTMPSKNFASSTHGTDSEDKVVITDNASVIVCWHPEKPFPYEFSRPLPEIEEADDSVLRVSKDVAARAIMKRKTDEQVRQELMKITHTTKHKWFPKNETRKRIQIHDREYL